jgi:hypothetical protein
MRPEFDARDAGILAEREQLFNQNQGPRVGDFLRVPDGVLRFTHDWGDSIQTTVGAKHPCYGDGSFYLSDGYASFSGSLDPAIDKTKLRDTGETLEGSFWFFHHNQACAENGVYFKLPCRVFEMVQEPKIKTLAGWHEAKVDLDRYLQIGDAVDEEMMDYFLGVLPPATFRANLIQIGEPYSHVNGRATFSTIYKPLGAPNWLYAGHCHRGEWTEAIAGVRVV